MDWMFFVTFSLATYKLISLIILKWENMNCLLTRNKAYRMWIKLRIKVLTRFYRFLELKILVHSIFITQFDKDLRGSEIKMYMNWT